MGNFNVVALAIGIGINIFAQIFSYKYFFTKKLLKTEYLGFLCGLIALIVCEIFICRVPAAGRFVSIWTDLTVYFCFSYCYFHFINMGETARRIRLLRELYDNPSGLSREEILRRYNAQEIIDTRIRRLVNNGQILLHDGRCYTGNPIMVIILKAMILMKLIVLGKREGFDAYGK